MNEAAWTDDPLDSAVDDTLGRQPYARQAADLIHNTHTFETSVVFGLSGPWGSGKSSLINMIVEQTHHLPCQVENRPRRPLIQLIARHWNAAFWAGVMHPCRRDARWRCQSLVRTRSGSTSQLRLA